MAAAVTLAWTVTASGIRWPSQGRFDGSVRTEIALGSRAVAVSEGPTVLEWSLAWTGAATVRQDVGAAFYRITPGAPFEIVTRAGTVRVNGTCVRVEVHPMNKATSMALSAAASAALATAVTVTVYEGSVEVASANEKTALKAGEQASLGEDGTVVRASSPRDRRTPVPAAAAAPSPDSTTLQVEIKRLQATNLSLRQQLTALQSAVRQQQAASSKRPPAAAYDHRPDQKTLLQMAKQCSLAWDMVHVSASRPARISTKDAEALELAESEVEVVNGVYAAYNEKMLDQLRTAYTELTGDEAVGSLSVQAMFAEILDKTPDEERRRIHKQLSAERAQLVPRSTAPASPTERVLRAYHEAGDRVEAALAAQLGEETARRIRDIRNGFSNKSRMNAGCPK